MSRFGGDPVTVPLGPCACPSTPHAGGDEVYLLPRLTYDGGSEAEAVIQSHLGKGDSDGIAVALCRAYIKHQATGWNLTDENGAPVPYSAELLLSDWTTARKVADKADDLYSEGLFAPLVEAVSMSLPPSPTAPSTSPRTRPASSRRKR